MILSNASFFWGIEMVSSVQLDRKEDLDWNSHSQHRTSSNVDKINRAFGALHAFGFTGLTVEKHRLSLPTLVLCSHLSAIEPG